MGMTEEPAKGGLTTARAEQLETLRRGASQPSLLPSSQVSTDPNADGDALLDSLREQRDALNRDIGTIVAYARSLRKPYSLRELAAPLGMSHAGVRTLTTDEDRQRAAWVQATCDRIMREALARGAAR